MKGRTMEQKIEIYESFPSAKLDAEFWATKGWFVHTIVGYSDALTGEKKSQYDDLETDQRSPQAFVVYRKSKKG